MSTTVLSKGWVAPLLQTIDDGEQREEISERLHDEGKHLELNYEGSLIMVDTMRAKSYSERESAAYDLTIIGRGQQDMTRQEFIETCRSAGFDVVEDKVLPYTCVWYNGSDSPMSMLEMHEFMAIWELEQQ
ncbi:hypothetical protein Axy13_014 [Achromobacter phage vB_AxyP_19-32_Axy13]|uniref:Uncharacterized protein n=1 Tax=Achromobacter phage vB_AxyP_19-32_Axy13 TaxID=2591044 RepID=A0A514CUQ2_9CAUD|nr:hypothetical protein Axy13_014 [Achromobacter phage vB_AxyP_19-32_Axy13]